MRISGDLTIKQSADRVWQIVAHDFAQIGEWASGIAHSSDNTDAAVPDGASVGGRICTVDGFGDIKETFINYNEADKSFTYRASGLPFFVASAENSWNIKAIDARTTHVTFAAEIKFIPIVGVILAIPMRLRLRRTVDEVIEELKFYAETGEIHPRKIALSSGTAQLNTAQ